MSQEIDKSKPGWEHFVDYTENFHERLASNWPEPREQLHAGGWRMTEKLCKLMKIEHRSGQSFLDLCCGEGSTACYLAKKYPTIKITGVDIVEKAINLATTTAKTEGVADRVNFVAANAFNLPFADATFDVVYGQDPDALSHEKRVLIFKELLRVLKPGGEFVFMHHWIPGPGFPEEEAKAIDKFNADLQFLAMSNCNADHYLSDLAEAGFERIAHEDLTDLAAAHLRGVALKHFEKNGKVQDKWLLNNLSYIDRGRPFGLQVVCHKPGGRSHSRGVDPTGFIVLSAVVVAFISFYHVHFQSSSR